MTAQQRPDGLPGAIWDGGEGPLADVLGGRPVRASETVLRGRVWDVVAEDVDLGHAGVVRREVVRHPGAVAVMALDPDDRVAFVRQYRHPVGAELWELPAGLLDVPGEDPRAAAERELAEEADLRASRWHVLVDWYGSPGGMDEALRLYLARDLSPVPPEDRHAREAEESGMPLRWVPLEVARDAVLAGNVQGPNSVIGVLAACAARDLGWRTLRSPDTPWERRSTGRR